MPASPSSHTESWTMESTANTAVRRASARKLPAAKVLIALLGILSGAMLGLAIPNLVSGDPLMIAVKSVILAASGIVVSYAVNRFAVEQGAPLAVRNYKWAGFVSVVSILSVGVGMFTATYSGLVLNDVRQLTIEVHGRALVPYIASQVDYASAAGRIAPAMSAIVIDLQQKQECEVEQSCMSGYAGGGGTGPFARILLEKLGRAQAIANEVQSGEQAREQAIEDITSLYGEYQTTAASTELDSAEKRIALGTFDLEIKQAASRLRESVPVDLLRAYAEELKAGASVPGNAASTAKITSLLYQYGQALDELIQTIPARTEDEPQFPAAPGVTDTFLYIGHFLPVASIAAVVELVFPISLWLYTVCALSWAAHQVSPAEPVRIAEEDEELQRLLASPRQAKADGQRDTARSSQPSSHSAGAERSFHATRNRRHH